MKNTLLLTALLISLSGNSQVLSTEIIGGNIRAYINSNGAFFQDIPAFSGGFEAPAFSGIHAIYTSNLWIGGSDESGILRMAAMRYCESAPMNCEYVRGPLALDGTTQTQITNQFGLIYRVYRQEIEVHQAYFNCIDDPLCDVAVLFPFGYVIPQHILNWPAMGNASLGMAEYLAPFYDHNADGIYNPELGDYPLFCGDLALYMMMNDAGTPHSDSGAQPIGLEIHAMVYIYFDIAPAIQNTVFVQLKLINRGAHTLTNTYAGMWTDIDLGNYMDDYVGCDVSRSMYYGYNGLDFDAPSDAGPGYQDDLGAIAIRILRGVYADPDGQDGEALPQPYTSYGNRTTGWGDGIADNERLGMSNFLYHRHPNEFGPFPTTDPTTAVQHYNYLSGRWKDGTMPSYGGIGYSTDVDALPCRYVYPGDSDPLLEGTSGVDPLYIAEGGWTEANENTIPGDRRAIATSGPFTFAPGDVQYLDYAYIFARDSHEPGVDVLETLRTYADAIVGMECGQLPQIVTSTRQGITTRNHISLYPNPAINTVTIESGISKGQYTVMDMVGRILMGGHINAAREVVDITGLPTGIYLVRVEGEGQIAAKKLMVK